MLIHASYAKTNRQSTADAAGLERLDVIFGLFQAEPRSLPQPFDRLDLSFGLDPLRLLREE